MDGEQPMDDDDDAVGMEYVVSGQSDAPVKSEQASNVEQEEQAKEDEPANEEVSEYLGMVSLSLCSLGNYTFGTSLRNKKKPWRSFANRMLDRKARYDVEGAPRATVEVVMMAHHNGIPHVLLLKSANPTITGTVFSLPHTRMRIGEGNATSLNRCLNKLVRDEKQWNVVAQIARWIRPDFNRHVYPYELPHASSPKEVIHVFVVQLEEFQAFATAEKVVAVPLMHLYKCESVYGDVIASLPLCVSRCCFLLN